VNLKTGKQMTNNELRNYFYDTAREYLDEHCPDFDRYYGEGEAHNAHVALVDLLCSAHNEGMDRAEDMIIVDLRAKTSSTFWSYPKSIFISLVNRYSKGEHYTP